MKNILKIQDLEMQIENLQKKVDSSPEKKQYEQIKKNRTVLIKNIETLDYNAGVLAKQIQQINKKYEELKGRSEITAKQKPEIMSVDNIDKLIEDANSLTGELANLELKLIEMNKMINEVVNNYARSYDELRTMTQKQQSLKGIVEQQQQSLVPKIAEIKQQIAKLEPLADKTLYEKYRSMSSSLPVFVHLKGNRCGNIRCGIELSLRFIENLKQARMLPCENCRSIIIADDFK